MDYLAATPNRFELYQMLIDDSNLSNSTRFQYKVHLKENFFPLSFKDNDFS